MSALWSAWGADAFTEQVEKATSELLPVGSEDIALNLEICDQVRAKQVPAKQAMQVLKRRVSHRNPNVVLLALGLTDICIKNGGDHFLQEVASREFMDNLVSILRNPAGVNNDVKAKALGLIQNWSQIAQAKPAHMSYITDIYKQLKADSHFDFPPLDPNAAASAALVETLTAPEWVDGEVCMRCRTAFTTFNRKHHCRNCGNVFCQQCSSHNMALPWFGIGQDVRVCDGCHARKGPPKNAVKLSRSKSASDASPSSSSSSKHVPSGRGASSSSSHHRSATSGGKSKRSAARQKEEDDLALAIKLSLEASGQGASQASRPEPFRTPSQPSAAPSSAQKAPNGRVLEGTDADDDPDLAAAIAASLRDWAPPQPSAPDGLGDAGGAAAAAPASGVSMPNNDSAHSNLSLPPSLDLAPQDVDNILTFSQTIRAQHAHNQANGLVGAPVPPPVQTLYERASSARPRMARNLEEGHRRHNVLVSMHDKLSEAVRLYDRLLDAQMTRPAQAYAPNGYAHSHYPAAAHAQSYGYGYEQGAPSSLYPQAPQAHAGPNAEYSGAPSHPQWHPQQQQYPQHDQQLAYQQQQQQQQQHSQPYALQPPPQSQYAPHDQQQPSQQYQQQQYVGPNAMSGYTNGAYADPNGAVSPAGAAAAPAQYAPYEYAGGARMDHASHARSQGTPLAGGVVGPQGPGALSVRTDGIMGGSPSHVSAAATAALPVEKIGAADDGQGDESIATSRLSADTSVSSRNGWSQVPIQAVAPPSQPETSTPQPSQAQQQQQQQQQYHAQQQRPQQQQPAAKADTSYLPLFPVAPHPDNGFGPERNGAEAASSPVASPCTNAPSSAGMWQSSAGKSPAAVNAAATESPLIEF
ncbi:related to VPS27-vacuolar protein sorting-associated protein [Sporisorium reilianum f. sp. reilianum]|uniref:Vacuolar protein sorting-associated protein 27 n=1 Tax=Sporisorium reilianum f. sp. reilianum TaxID=72559 RepID=A0A2N8UH73_9BASI|nr:related to VPS27-vacuolar protein sorting-associated protein [Sporisorium reilianum f. sp. reilianum]